jgi:hypothetical protein
MAAIESAELLAASGASLNAHCNKRLPRRPQFNLSIDKPTGVTVSLSSTPILSNVLIPDRDSLSFEEFFVEQKVESM